MKSSKTAEKWKCGGNTKCISSTPEHTSTIQTPVRWIQGENLKVCEDIPEGEIPCSCCKPAAEHHHRVNLDDGETTVWDEYLMGVSE